MSPQRNGAAVAASPPVTGQLSPDLAELLSQKIREMERQTADELEKKNGKQKGLARAAAKTKLKEAKKLLADADVPDSEKVEKLWERLKTEHEAVLSLESKESRSTDDLAKVETERRRAQAELTRTLGVRSKLESLCRQLQQQSDALVEERKRLTDAERLRRHELADQYQHTIEDVKKKMDTQATERARLARENEDLRTSFKRFIEKYDGSEKELLEQQKTREEEVAILNKKLEESANAYQADRTREAAAQRDYDDLSSAEQKLKEQLQTYQGKYSNFHDALTKSDKVLGQYKRQKNKMQRRVEVLEKENQELRTRAEKRLNVLIRDRDGLAKEKQVLQEKCKKLQAERVKLLEEETS